VKTICPTGESTCKKERGHFLQVIRDVRPKPATLPALHPKPFFKDFLQYVHFPLDMRKRIRYTSLVSHNVRLVGGFSPVRHSGESGSFRVASLHGLEENPNQQPKFGGNIMKFLSVRDLRGKSSQVWRELPEQKEMVVTNNGRPIAILSSINEENLEQVLSAFRRARAMEAVATLQYESMMQGTDKITMDEVDAEIQAVRK
jgi:antitoxin (DNA-binding transcriptional repressor) of toxin-antitoxin stability system